MISPDSSEYNPAPSGSWRQGYQTKPVTDEYMRKHLRAYINLRQGRQKYDGISLHGTPQMTVHSCWSGYSEYTITNQWDEIEVVWDGHRCYFGNTTAFFKEMAVVDIEGWD